MQILREPVPMILMAVAVIEIVYLTDLPHAVKNGGALGITVVGLLVLIGVILYGLITGKQKKEREADSKE